MLYGGTGYMSGITDKYVNPFTDFGFKRIFGSEENKDMLIDFLNALLQKEEHKIEYIEEIADVTLLDKEQLGAKWERPAIFDIYCITPNGERFVVEMQQGHQSHFRDRMLYYASYVIRTQGQRGGDWNYRLKPMYMIGLLNFNLDEGEEFHHVERIRQDGDFKVTNKNLTFIYIEMKKFKKTIEETKDKYEEWLFALKNLRGLPDIPEKLHTEPFEKLFDIASIINFTEEECAEYEKDIDTLRSEFATIESATERGLKVGIERGIERGEKNKALKIAKNLLARGMSLEEVSVATELSIKEVKELLE